VYYFPFTFVEFQEVSVRPFSPAYRVPPEHQAYLPEVSTTQFSLGSSANVQGQGTWHPTDQFTNTDVEHC